MVTIIMNKWSHLLPSHIRTSFMMPTNNEPTIDEDVDKSSLFIDYNIPTTTKPSTYDPNKDVTMLQAKIKALEEYVELLLNVINEYETNECKILRTSSDPGIYFVDDSYLI